MSTDLQPPTPAELEDASSETLAEALSEAIDRRTNGSSLPLEVQAICTVLLKRGASKTDIAKVLKIDRHTVRKIELTVEHRNALAKEVLEQSVVDAAKSFAESVDIAAKKGRHEPARDLLQAVGVIEAKPDKAPQVNIGIALHGGTGPQELVLEAKP